MTREPSAKYYQRNKEKIQEYLRERYQNLTEEGKNKRREYGRERYENFVEDEKKPSLV